MNFQIYDVMAVIVQNDMLVAALFDGREGQEAIMIIRPVIKNGMAVLEKSEPDGLERWQWLDRFGLLPEEQLNEIYKKVQGEDERRQIYNALREEFDDPRAAQLDKRERNADQKEKELKIWEERLKKQAEQEG